MKRNYDNAAESLLGEKYASFLSNLDKSWYIKNSKAWDNNCKKYQETLRSLKRLENKQIVREKRFFELEYQIENKKISNKLWKDFIFPYDYTIIVFHNSSPALYKRIKKVKNSLIYKK